MKRHRWESEFVGPERLREIMEELSRQLARSSSETPDDDGTDLPEYTPLPDGGTLAEFRGSKKTKPSRK